jgi:multiple sugar transport system permease protein
MADWILVTLIVVSVWQFFPFVFVALLARMRRIPPAMYRSAQLDGASEWEQFRFLTLPSITSTLITVAILRFAFMFTKFDTPWLLGGNSANAAVQTLPVYVYQHISIDPHLKTGVSAAVVTALILLIIFGVIFGARFFWYQRGGVK